MRNHLALAFAGLASLALLLSPAPVEAGCGFYAPPATASGAALVNDADQVVMMREGSRIALTMSTNYKGPAEDFAMIVPVPVVLKKESVKTLSPAIFTHLETLTAPRIVEYAEANPCPSQNDGVAPSGGAPPGGGLEGVSGKGGGGGGGVKVEAEFVSGEYDIVVLSATESDGLEKWLIAHKYNVPTGASTALAPYVTAGQKFVVAKVDSKRVLRDASGVVVLSPLRFVYDTSDFRLPVRLGLLNAPPGGKQDVIVYLLARDHRVESANYPNLFAPTNVDVDASVLDTLGSFYAALFDATIKKSGGRGIVTEYAWNASGCGAPCTGPALSVAEVQTLGADDLVGTFGLADFALTRVHARYDASTLSEDIVFRTADPIAGGREGDPGADKVQTVNDGTLGFQTKYAVRRPWQGAIECEHPHRGQWVVSAGEPRPPALGLAAAARDVSLDRLVASPIQALGLAPQRPGYGSIVEQVAPSHKTKTPSNSATDAKTDAPSDATPWTWIAVAIVAMILLGGGVWMVRRR